jgi:hypothetical protein
VSVVSETLGYNEVCKKSHEFLRRGCSRTPMQYSWAGDLILVKEELLKQSEVNDIRGGGGVVAHTFPAIGGTGCGDETVSMPQQYEVTETGIRNGDFNTFNYEVTKNNNREVEGNWTLDILQSENDCGVMMDGGDVLQILNPSYKAMSLCGTIILDSGLAETQAHYLDNRESYADDPDNGLLVAIRTGFVDGWRVRYARKEVDLTSGLIVSDDITEKFMEQIVVLGMTQEDIIEFGMI